MPQEKKKKKGMKRPSKIARRESSNQAFTYDSRSIRKQAQVGKWTHKLKRISTKNIKERQKDK